jgi:MFS transporter, PAT family, beta-lactamase induction signal transducer AmpG
MNIRAGRLLPDVSNMTTRRKLFWVAVLYLAEGFPFGVVKKIVPVYLRQLGVSLVDIGFISGLVALPWTLKVLWAPAVDRWGSRRTWIVVSQALISLSLLTLAAVHSVSLVWIIAAMLLILAFFAATQDIAIDAYTIGLLEKAELGPANGVRVTAYRVALIAAGGLFVAAAGIAGWSLVFLAAALLMAGLCLMSFRAPSLALTGVDERPPQSLQEAILAPLRQFLGRSGFLAVALFILTFKLGDMALGPMVEPFWVDRQFSLVQIGLVPGTIGVLATIGGALLGGILTRRWGIFRALWVLGMFQAVSNLIYAAAAALPPSDALMYVASIGESFCGGLGTAPFLAFLMSICDKAYAATQYALLSSLFGLTGALSGAVSGFATQSLGYATYFTLTFFLAWPAYLLLPWVKQWTMPERESQPV